MVVLICGSRYMTSETKIKDLIDSLQFDDIVIHGGAAGADSIADRLAKERGLAVMQFNADWNRHGRAAGPIRNKLMLDVGAPDVVHAFPLIGADNSGTRNMMDLAEKAGVPVIVHIVEKEGGDIG